MSRYVYQLKFVTPVRFGRNDYSVNLSSSEYYCDSSLLFSAISNEWVSIYGVEDYEKFVSQIKDNKFLISGLLPYLDDELFVPKPILYVQREQKVNDKSNSSEIKKIMKKLKFIPIKHYKDYINFIKGTRELDFNFKTDFATEVSTTRASISRELEGDALPYVVSGYKFNKNAGLYFILETTDEIKEKIDLIIKSLGLSGIGGKRSSGFGKFELLDDAYELDKEYPLYDCDVDLFNLLSDNGDYYMSLSILKPNSNDMNKFNSNENYYSIVKKSGFVFSEYYSKNLLKKKDAFVFSGGSCFKEKFEGTLEDVSTSSGKHPVYLYGKTMYLGVKL